MKRKNRRPRKLSAWLAMHINSKRWEQEAEAAAPRGLFPGGHPGTNSFPTAGA